MDKGIKIKLLELEALLVSHDWHYMMSDDFSYYESGSRSASLIETLRKELKDLGMATEVDKLYDEYSPKTMF